MLGLRLLRHVVEDSVRVLARLGRLQLEHALHLQLRDLVLLVLNQHGLLVQVQLHVHVLHIVLELLDVGRGSFARLRHGLVLLSAELEPLVHLAALARFVLKLLLLVTARSHISLNVHLHVVEFLDLEGELALLVVKLVNFS